MTGKAVNQQNFENKKARLLRDFNKKKHNNFRLGKSTSNLFRQRQRQSVKIDVRAFNQVIYINPEERWADVEGMCTYENLVDGTLNFSLMPAVVPELKTITIGGATTGLGIESSSFRYGLVHETVIEMEILLANGSTLVCSDTQHADLFYGFPNSYGTLGYVLKLRILLVPVQPFVQLYHRRFANSDDYFQAVRSACNGDHNFVDGTIFNAKELYLTTADFTDHAKNPADYSLKNIYYRSIQQKSEDCLTTKDYIWRWDTDWFWCSKNLGMQNPVLRLIAGRRFLNSRTYWKIMAWNRRYRVTEFIGLIFSLPAKESIIQDVEIPIENANRFLQFLLDQIGISPIWMCPTRPINADKQYTLYEMEPKLYINFGFWQAINSKREDGYYNRQIEHCIRQLGGKKSLYSDVYYDPDEFWSLYNKPAYDALKEKYDANGIFSNLYEKCVERR